MTWRSLPISLTELCIDKTLRCGQSFRWIKSAPDTYSCAIHGRLISLRQDSQNLYYRALRPLFARKSYSAKDPEVPLTPPSSISAEVKSEDERPGLEVGDGEEESEEEAQETEAFLRHYLNLGPNLGELYESWSASDANFKKKAPRFTGIRILKQDAWEALVGFICSSNNNIQRISQMMHKLSAHYGTPIATLNSHPYYDLPPPSSLTNPTVESHLRALGFGYRAKYIHQTALILSRSPPGWLDSLRNPESPFFNSASPPSSAGSMLSNGRAGYRTAHEALLTLQGVGPKVADCVCLMGLGWGEAVPVDTHVWAIAQRDYRFGKGKNASLTKATYDAVGDHFRDLWGSEAGWAHSVLFTADLRAFAEGKRIKVEKAEKADGGREVKVEEVEVVVKLEVSPLETPRMKGRRKEVVSAQETLSVETLSTKSKKRRSVAFTGGEEVRNEKKVKMEPRLGARQSLRQSLRRSIEC